MKKIVHQMSFIIAIIHTWKISGHIVTPQTSKPIVYGVNLHTRRCDTFEWIERRAKFIGQLLVFASSKELFHNNL